MTREEYIRLTDLYLTDIYRVAYSGCRNSYDAEDITQEVFEALFRYPKAFEVTDTEKENCSSMQELVIPYLKGAEIDISEVNQNVVAFSSDAYEIKLSYLNLLVTTRDYDIDSLVIIEEDGNRIDVIKDGNIQKVENQWCGPFQSLDEDGTQVLDYTLGKAVDPEHVQVELDGHVLK